MNKDKTIMTTWEIFPLNEEKSNTFSFIFYINDIYKLSLFFYSNYNKSIKYIKELELKGDIKLEKKMKINLKIKIKNL
jgi:hypothetical protein